MANIKVTPAELKTHAAALQKLSAHLSDVLKQIDGKVGEIDAGWDGLAQQGYIAMYQTMAKKLKEAPELVLKLSESTAKVADQFEQTDSRLQSAFKV